ncbi:ABC-type transport auxiliary lipoprotein family protein [Massilia sp. B-10]|nr:ABC-type transport auxiliary lipoprotein family protein [Massilia sp. B-10]
MTDVTGSPALDNERMYYRLNYADPLQARSYAHSRWSASPLQMVTGRLKARIAQSGAKVLSATDASTGVAILRTEIDDFTHSFDSQAQSQGSVVLRASLFRGHKLIDQKTFSRRTAATSLDAVAACRALAASTDAIAADIVAWLATLPQPKE